MNLPRWSHLRRALFLVLVAFSSACVGDLMCGEMCAPNGATMKCSEFTASKCPLDKGCTLGTCECTSSSCDTSTYNACLAGGSEKACSDATGCSWVQKCAGNAALCRVERNCD